MKTLITVAQKWGDLERARLWKETEDRANQVREELAAKGLSSSSAHSWAMAQLGEDSIRAHGEATWQALRNILESSPRIYYLGGEIEQVKAFVLARFSTKPEHELELVDSALLSGLPASSHHQQALEKVEKAQVTARERIEAEVDKYFCTRRDLSRWIMEFTQHPLVSHVLIFILGALVFYLFQKLGWASSPPARSQSFVDGF